MYVCVSQLGKMIIKVGKHPTIAFYSKSSVHFVIIYCIFIVITVVTTNFPISVILCFVSIDRTMSFTKS